MSDLQRSIERFFALTDALAWEERAELLTEDVDWVTPAGAATGRQATIDFSVGMGTAFPTMRHVVDKVLVAGDHVVAEGRWQATNAGPLTTPTGTIEATGRSLEVTWSAIFRRDAASGAIDSVHVYFDQMSMLGQLGLLPVPASA